MSSSKLINNETILIVDDEELILQILEIGLSNAGYEVVSVKNAVKALAAARQSKFKYAVIDIKLPDENGIVLSRKIKKLCPGIVIILMTGYPGINSTIEALRQHVYDYLIKPFRVEQVISVINRSKREYALIGEKQYNGEIIRRLKDENRQLKTMLSKFIPDEERLRIKSLDKYRTLKSNQELVLQSYAKQQGDKKNKKNSKQD